MIANLQVAAENQTAARSRIIDADFAAETANLSRAQILQQAGTAMVAQANQLPQQVLTAAALDPRKADRPFNEPATRDSGSIAPATGRSATDTA